MAYIHPPEVRGPLADYCREVANRMGLVDWTFTMYWHPPGDDTPDEEDTVITARCRPTFGRKHACLEFKEGIQYDDPLSLRDTVCHEMTHCHLAFLQNVLENEVKWEVHESQWDQVWSNIRRTLEIGVDGIAGAWSIFLPLIVWDAGVKKSSKKREKKALKDPHAYTSIPKGYPEQYREVPWAGTYG